MTDPFTIYTAISIVTIAAIVVGALVQHRRLYHRDGTPR